MVSPAVGQGFPHKAAFAGDDELLVDRLIAACAKSPVTTPAKPLAERQLVPFFLPGTDEWDESSVNVALAIGRVCRPATSSKPAAGKQRNSIGTPSSAAKIHAKLRTKPVTPSAPLPTPNIKAARRAASLDLNATRAPKTNTRGSKPSTPTAQQQKLASDNFASPTYKRMGSGSWAGPGFCNSPAPEQLPMPSAGLLLSNSKANLSERAGSVSSSTASIPDITGSVDSSSSDATGTELLRRMLLK
jgi:hypothetical protein